MMLSEGIAVAIPQVTLSEEIKVTFTLDPEEKHVAICYSINGHVHEMMRTKDEPVGNVLRRITIKVDQALRGSSKKKKALKTKGLEASLVGEAKLMFGGKPVDEALPNVAAWVEGSMLVVGPNKSTVRVNPPSVRTLAVSPGCMVDFAIVAHAQLGFADLSETLWTWRRLDDDSDVTMDSRAPLRPDLPVVGREHVYRPTRSDLGRQLVVECVPVAASGTRGAAVRAVTRAVTAPPVDAYPFSRIHQHSLAYYPDSAHLRVVTYNILADVYATSDYAREKLYPYCSHHATDPLSIDYRQCLIARELSGYHADVVCLQELGDSCCTSFLRPLLKAEGFSCHYKTKEGKMPEGVGTALRLARLQPVEEVGVSLNRFLLEDPSAAELLHLLRGCPRLLSFLASKTSVVLVVIAKVVQREDDIHFKEGRSAMETDDLEERAALSSSSAVRYVAVANTHLYFHPKADHIRLLQAHIALMVLRRTMERFRDKTVAEGGSNFTIAPVFAGDFNSSPLNGVHEYFVNGSVPSSHSDWSVAPEYETVKYREHLSWLAEQGRKTGSSAGNDVKGSSPNLCTVSKRAMCQSEGNHTAVSNNSKPLASTHPNAKTAATASNRKGKNNSTSSSPHEERQRSMNTIPQLLATAGIPDLRTVFNTTSDQLHPEIFPGIDLKHNFDFICASGLPMYTNYTTGFAETLDYIFADSDHFSVAREIALPTHKEVTANTALPSVQFPSDHLALVCDLKWKHM